MFMIKGGSETCKHNQIILSQDIKEVRVRSRVARVIIYCTLMSKLV